jgi:L-fucose isomerase-like protein
MEKVRLGYIPVAKTNFDLKLAEEICREALNMLKNYKRVEIVSSKLIILDSEVGNIINLFKEKQIDLLVLHFCTFCLGNIIPALATNLDTPMVLLATPEPDFKGNRLRSNAFCALNMNSHTLYKLKIKHRSIFKSLKDNTLSEELGKIILAIYAINNMKNKRIGLIGSRAPGFYTSNFDELKLRNELGIEIEQIDISKVYLGAEKINEKEVLVESENLLKSINNQTKVSNKHLNNLIRTRKSFSNISQEYRLDAFGIKCWPEFHVDYGTTICPALGMMNSKGLPTACEGDIYGAVTMIMQKYISGEISFFADFIFSEVKKNTGLFWHCGSAPIELAEDKSKIVLNNFSVIQKGVPERGCAMDFQIYSENKRATINRVGTDSDGNFRVLNITGSGIKSNQHLRGNYCQLKFDTPVESIIKGILDNGFEHHYSIVMKDISAVVEEIAFWKNFKVYRF